MSRQQPPEFTKLELEFIAYFMETEYCVCGGYVFHDEWNMKQTRGVMASLVKKGVITTLIVDEDVPDSTWISIDEDRFEEFKNILKINGIKWMW